MNYADVTLDAIFSDQMILKIKNKIEKLGN